MPKSDAQNERGGKRSIYRCKAAASCDEADLTENKRRSKKEEENLVLPNQPKPAPKVKNKRKILLYQVWESTQKTKELRPAESDSVRILNG